jgi:hypothetical protein
MKKVNLTRSTVFFILFCSNSFCIAQFLEYRSSSKTSSVEIGISNNYFHPLEDNQFINSFRFTEIIPYIAYRNRNLYLCLGYNRITSNGIKTHETFLDGFYGNDFPIWGDIMNGVSIPLFLRTSYLVLDRVLNITQISNSYSENFEVGDLGIGTGLKFNHDFEFLILNFRYSFFVNYSTVSLSSKYGYSLLNEIELFFHMDKMFDDFGIILGAKYTDKRWSISDKMYNYFGSWASGFIGVSF